MGDDRVVLRFVMEEAGTPFTVRVEPPILATRKKEHGRYGSVVTMPDAGASMRLLMWWLKSKLEAIRYGLVTAQEEFLANVAGTLQDGREVTIGQLIIPRLAQLPASDMAKIVRALPSGEPQ